MFNEEFRARVVLEFGRRLDAGAFQCDSRYDVLKLGVVPTDEGPFAVFFSRAWLELLTRLFDLEASGGVSAMLLHHTVNSISGSINDDRNPWGFPARGGSTEPQEIVASGSSKSHNPSYRASDEAPTVEWSRAVTVIYHLATPTGPSYGGEIGLYSSKSQPVNRPTVRVPLTENALVAFECTPYSLHSIITNKTSVRNSIVMWIHRPGEDAVRRFGLDKFAGW